MISASRPKADAAPAAVIAAKPPKMPANALALLISRSVMLRPSMLRRPRLSNAFDANKSGSLQ